MGSSMASFPFQLQSQIQLEECGATSPPPADHQLCQSRTWTSPEFQKVKDFNRMRERLHHLGLGHSPFVPSTPSELVGLRAEMLAAQAVRIAAGVRERERLAACRNSGLLPKQEPRLFGGKSIQGDLSAVFALNLVWNDNICSQTGSRDDADASSRRDASWPTLTEYRAWGSILPLPRSILSSAEVEMAEKEASWLNPETLGP